MIAAAFLAVAATACAIMPAAMTTMSMFPVRVVFLAMSVLPAFAVVFAITHVTALPVSFFLAMLVLRFCKY